MLLAVDVGNSNIVFGIWDGHGWVEQVRMQTHPIKKADEFASLFDDLPEDISVESAIISSVVPVLNEPLHQALYQTFGVDALILTSETDTGILLGADHPERVGADLIADAVGAFALVEDNCIVVDFGTATTVMAVETPGKLTGVAICTGLEVSVDALVSKTAQLPDIPLEIPDAPLGTNTVTAMQSGLVLGHLCMIEGLIDRIKKEKDIAAVVATGGLVPLFAPHTKHFDFVEPTLTLDGLRMIVERVDGRRQM